MEKRIDKLSKKRTRFVKTVANEEIEPSPTYDDESTPPIEPPQELGGKRTKFVQKSDIESMPVDIGESEDLGTPLQQQITPTTPQLAQLISE